MPRASAYFHVGECDLELWMTTNWLWSSMGRSCVSLLGMRWASLLICLSFMYLCTHLATSLQ